MEINTKTLKIVFQINRDFVLSNREQRCLINIDREEVLNLNEVAYEILDQINQGKNTLSLVQLLCKRYENIIKDVLIKDLVNLLELLTEMEIIKISP